jgi:hypothetical protein
MFVVDDPGPLPDGAPVRAEALFTPSFWHSLDEPVAAPATVDDLLGGWPANERDDKFDEAFVRWRAGTGRTT